MSVTIIDIAKQTGFSKTTVHRVLSGASRVAPETRTKIQEWAKKHNYEPNVQARALKGARTYIIGIMVPNLGNIDYANMIYGAEVEAEKNGYSTLVFLAHDNMERQLNILNRVHNHGVEGLIFTSMHKYESSQDNFVDMLFEKKIPAVGIHHFLDNRISSVVCNDMTGAERAIEYLIQLGHRRIAYVTINQPQDLGIALKLKGYQQMLASNGIKFNPELIACQDKYYSYEAGYKATMKLMRQDNPPTAIFALCDTIAVGVYKALKELGLKIPDDISVIGYDNKQFTDVMEPPLTTVSVPSYKVGQQAAKELLVKIKKKDSKTRKILLEPELTVKESCRKI